MLVRVELDDATVDFAVADKAEAERVIRALTGFAWWRRFAVFDYDGGQRQACVLRKAIKRAGMLTVDEAGQGEP